MRFISRKAHLLTGLLLACMFHLFQCIDLFDVHKKGSVFTQDRVVYFAYNNTKHVIPNRFTFIGYGNWEPGPGTPEQKALPKGEDIDNLWKPNTPCQYVLDSTGKAYGEELIVELDRWVWGYSNAALLYRPAPFGDWIIKLAKNRPNSRDGGDGYEFRGEAEFRLLHVDPAVHTHLGIAVVPGFPLAKNISLATSWVTEHLQDFTSETPSVPHVDTAGIDPRLVVVEGGGGGEGTLAAAGAASRGAETNHAGNVVVMFAIHHRRAPALYTADVVIPKALPKPAAVAPLALVNVKQMALKDTPLYRQADPQKNWVPFSYKNEVYYVSHLWPFNAVKLAETHAVPRTVPSIANVTVLVDQWVVSMGTDMPWRFGPPHGSTQGVRMQNGEYLSFFHSYTGHQRDKVAQTYVIGAVTWKPVEVESAAATGGNTGSTTEVKFQLTRMTTTPIVPTQHECTDRSKCANFYRDRWLHDQRLFGYIDYAIFPVSLLVDGKYAYVAFAYQNIDNYIAKIGIDALLATMVDVRNLTSPAAPPPHKDTDNTDTHKARNKAQ